MEGAFPVLRFLVAPVKVGDKNKHKAELKKGLNAIINALKANYPDTYKTELRNWGFQKEKY